MPPAAARRPCAGAAGPGSGTEQRGPRRRAGCAGPGDSRAAPACSNVLQRRWDAGALRGWHKGASSADAVGFIRAHLAVSEFTCYNLLLVQRGKIPLLFMTA